MSFRGREFYREYVVSSSHNADGKWEVLGIAHDNTKRSFCSFDHFDIAEKIARTLNSSTPSEIESVADEITAKFNDFRHKLEIADEKTLSNSLALEIMHSDAPSLSSVLNEYSKEIAWSFQNLFRKFDLSWSLVDFNIATTNSARNLLRTLSSPYSFREKSFELMAITALSQSIDSDDFARYMNILNPIIESEPLPPILKAAILDDDLRETDAYDVYLFFKEFEFTAAHQLHYKGFASDSVENIILEFKRIENASSMTLSSMANMAADYCLGLAEDYGLDTRPRGF